MADAWRHEASSLQFAVCRHNAQSFVMSQERSRSRSPARSVSGSRDRGTADRGGESEKVARSRSRSRSGDRKGSLIPQSLLVRNVSYNVSVDDIRQ